MRVAFPAHTAPERRRSGGTKRIRSTWSRSSISKIRAARRILRSCTAVSLTAASLTAASLTAASLTGRAGLDREGVDALARNVAERGVDQALALHARDPCKGGAFDLTVKCDSPDPSSPIWPLWLALSLMTARLLGAKAAVSNWVIPWARGPVHVFHLSLKIAHVEGS